MAEYITKPIAEFFTAAKLSYSYDLKRNIYIWFGLLWGVPIPLISYLSYAHCLEISGANTPYLSALASPVQWFFLAHPLMFGLVFGILGTIRNEKTVEHHEMIRKLEVLSTLDPLTGLYNRRYFAHIFHDECARNLRRVESMTILFLDLDHFKQVNDVHGHHFGDLALQAVSTCFKEKCRPYDTVVRWGGEEFVILLRATDETSALVFAERIRNAIQYELNETLPFSLTVSIGLSQYQNNDSLELLIDRADKALFYAKQTGRNKTVPWSIMPPQD
ncbi:MAG: GGDEF domain-containing protein [Bacteroidetes bacterium]|nr:GGDEF domain-containing protein [Bacteroidota bacterium]